MGAGADGAVDRADVLGVLSLIVWALTVTVGMNYAWLILRIDNDGEGGVLALAALASKVRRPSPLATGKQAKKGLPVTLLLGMFGTALLLSDGMITPAISVLGALEGLNVVAPGLSSVAVPVALVIVAGLFSVQRHGTRRMGGFFGPIILVWFITLGVLGVRGIVSNPDVLAAINPIHAIRFFVGHGVGSLLVLGAVFLVVTGAEALYADLGHFGARSIRIGWWCVALPGLLLNYLGQGARVLEDASIVDNPFYHLAPAWFQIPLLLLATMATIVASQALITGVFSLTRQAVMLGLTPRLEIRHTSESHIGQVYVPFMNWFLFLGTSSMIVGFGTAARIASAYGLAVAITMLMTTTLLFLYLFGGRIWPLWKCLLIVVPLVLIDTAFVGANMMKFLSGGWIPLLLAAGVSLVLVTWARGQAYLSQWTDEVGLSEEEFFTSLDRRPPTRVKGTAIVVTRLRAGVPRMLLHLLKHTKTLHETVVLLTVDVASSPKVPEAERLQVTMIREGCFRVRALYGFMERPDVPKLLKDGSDAGVLPKLRDSTFFIGRVTLIPATRKRLRWFPRGLFFFLANNAFEVTRHFHIPPSRSVEIGVPVEL